MKTTLSVLAAICLFFGTMGTTSAQSYSSAIGARLGVPLAISYKKATSGKGALEAYVAFRSFNRNYSWISLNAAYQVHNPIPDLEGLYWYYGIGGGLQFYNYDRGFVGDDNSSTGFTVSGYLGLDFTFADAPINLSLDWSPTLFLSGFATGFGADYGSLAIRYVIAR